MLRKLETLVFVGPNGDLSQEVPGITKYPETILYCVNIKEERISKNSDTVQGTSKTLCVTSKTFHIHSKSIRKIGCDIIE
jgi:hypothetical protein